jgi:DNA-binding FrmR family transcriptional regulator
MFAISSFRSASSFDISSDSFQELLQKQLDLVKKNAAAIDGLSRRMDLDKKAWARERVEEIKKQIEALRKMLLLFGGKDAKSLLQQLKQLASQLKQAAEILQTPSDSGVADVAAAPPAQVGDAYAEGRNAYAEQQASADAEAIPLPAAPFDMQRAEDERQLAWTSQALKSLKAAVERMAKQRDAAAQLAG